MRIHAREPRLAQGADRQARSSLFYPPMMDIIEQVVAVATAVLIPVRCSIFDVNAIDPVTAMCP